jgi:imidazolonepropionase-like amidohydrolase
VERGRIQRIDASRRGDVSGDAVVIDGGGRTLMPGLTDAHVHLGILDWDRPPKDRTWIEYVLDVLDNIKGALQEGFTTVRDAGGLEPAFAKVVRNARVAGPTILPSGSFISQTGGHGDPRTPGELHPPAAIPGLVAFSELADGPDAVRRAAREQFRRGATQIKVMASGGIMSETDPADRVQFSRDELAAVVEVATAYGSYVLAHCLPDAAIRVAAEAGVRSIEHAAMLEEDTARWLATTDSFMVSTLTIMELLVERDRRGELGEPFSTKLAAIAEAPYRALKLAHECGVPVASGSDVVGTRQTGWARELELKARVIGDHDAIISATRTNARLFGLDHDIGTIEPGKVADLILVAGPPIDDVAILSDPANVHLVMRGGEIMKDLVTPTGSPAESSV